MQSDTIGALAAALAAAQGELRDLERTVEGQIGRSRGYRYADLAACLEEVRPALSRHGLALIQLVGPVVPPAHADDLPSISVDTILAHESGEWMSTRTTMPFMIPDYLSPAQAAGVAITYARRYALTALVGLSQVDSDGDLPERPAPPSKAASTVQTKAPAPAGPAMCSPVQRQDILSRARAHWPVETGANLEAWLASRNWPTRSADLTAEQAAQVIRDLPLPEEVL